ncbi:hypothetical protein [Nonomuraea gerenzanensis]|uniref:Uncharacterized protein n=1 Tax=Nonomuraea gerenzanensis TaxID=93944 RepID=A0A1M4EIE6_9ACTN|nr:hypothetical protein [Nonomuraea gerenzanensis]UBU10195.1 hypothetical protein LCN96_38395 [Nonomuraea gerenzanensis]SBO98570.1 hypothetical protein BN4615_P8086 [Nonomuraea gerenzanensis]
MDALTAAGLGAVGGAVIEILYVWSSLTAWQQARRKARAKRRSGRLPRLDDYLDPVADSLVAATRLALGAAACLLFRDQITGTMAAIAVGASAPALLRQVGTLRSLRGVPDTPAEQPREATP